MNSLTPEMVYIAHNYSCVEVCVTNNRGATSSELCILQHGVITKFCECLLKYNKHIFECRSMDRLDVHMHFSYNLDSVESLSNIL